MAQLLSKVTADQATACRLHIVDEARQVEIGRQLQQGMHVIGLAIELDQLTAPVGAALGDNLVQPGEDGRGDAAPPVFGDQHQVITKRINAVICFAKLDIPAHATNLVVMAEPVNRRVTYKLYPSRAQTVALGRACALHQQLYNAALEERIDAYRKCGKSISFADQCKSLTEIRAAHPEYLSLNAQAMQVTLKRLDLAFKAFFRRCKAGEKPGFPRFKSKDRFPGFGFKTHGDGFRFTPGEGWRHGRLRLSGIGDMAARGEARTPGRIVRADVMRKVDGWFLSLVVECEPHRERGEMECGLDWGVETFATIAHGPFDFAEFQNDRIYADDQEALKTAQRALKGKRTKRAAQQRKLLARRWRRVANRRKNRNHQVTARLVRDHKLIVTERLAIENMTATAKGTADKPGKRVRQKAGLNRAILDATPGGFLSNLYAKAEEAGCQVLVLETGKHKPSQTCPLSGAVVKKPLRQRTHTLPDGRVIGRDQAAALSMLVAGLRLLGREPAWARISGPETTSHSREAA